MTCGIYEIRNRLTGKVYIGQSQDIESRWRGHLRTLRNGKHKNLKLLRSFNMHGETAFEFTVLEICHISILNAREQFWMDAKDSYRNGYNARPLAASNRGNTFDAETRARIRALRKKTWENPALRARMSEIVKARSADPEFMERWRQLHAQAVARPERNSRLSERATRAWSDPKVRVRQVAAQTAAQRRPEVSARKSEAAKRQMRGQSKITADDVLAIRRRYVKGHPQHGGTALACEYGLSQPTISAIVLRRIWRDVW